MEAAIYATAGLLLLAFLSSIGWLATKKPLTYNVYGKKIVIGLAAIVGLAMAFSIGALVAAEAVRPFVRAEDASAFVDAIRRIEMAAFLVGLACCILGGLMWVIAKISVHIYEHEWGEDDGN